MIEIQVKSIDVSFKSLKVVLTDIPHVGEELHVDTGGEYLTVKVKRLLHLCYSHEQYIEWRRISPEKFDRNIVVYAELIDREDKYKERR